MASLDWQVKAHKLVLTGELTRETLRPLWEQRANLLQNTINEIDVASLERVDSAGLALLLHFQGEGEQPERVLIGITDKLQTLMTLYNLKQVINNE